jgi:hypothetical protein
MNQGSDPWRRNEKNCPASVTIRGIAVQLTELAAMSNPEGLARALELIENEKREKTGMLDLGNCGLTELPETVGELPWLEKLVIGRYYFNGYGGWRPSGIFRLKNHLVTAISIVISYNQLDHEKL